MSNKQCTLAKVIGFEGTGLHTGTTAKITVHPGEVNSGFRIRTGSTEFAVSPDIGDGANHRTVLRSGDCELHTVEHLFAALHGIGIDNAVFEVEGSEIPGMDGSARPFVEAALEAGLVEQDAERVVFTPKQPVSVSFGKSSIMAFPSKDGQMRVTYILNYPESPLAQGTVEFTVTPDSIRAELAPCRTFVMKCHAEAMLQAGMGQGASTENTVVLDGETVVDNELRFSNECARHKVLDVIGDMATLGMRLGVHIVAYKSGHALNLELAKLLAAEMRRETHPRGLMDIRQIESTLPHRYPFLLVDRVIAMEPRKWIRTFKNLTRNEDFFNGHFPGQPIMPGVLQVEALAQSGGLLLLGEAEYSGKLAVLMGVDKVKYRRPVVPGDRLYMDVKITKIRGRIGVVSACATVDGEVATQCEIKFALVDPDQYT